MRFRLFLVSFMVLVVAGPASAFNWLHPFSLPFSNPFRDSAPVPAVAPITSTGYHAGISLVPTFGAMSSYATINGIDVNYTDSLGLARDVTMFELSGFVAINKASVKGYYLFPTTLSGNGILPSGTNPNAKDKDKPLTVSSSWWLSAGRLELGLPIAVNQAFTVEPQFVWQWINPMLEISGDNYSFNRSTKLSQGGIGVEATERITNYSSLKAKYLTTSDSSLFQLKYLLYEKLGYFSAGWNWWKYDIDRATTRMSGPFVEVSIGF